MNARRMVGVCLVLAGTFHHRGARADGGLTEACENAFVGGQRAYKLDHDLLSAREKLLVCAKECPEQLRVTCGGWLEEIAKELPSIVIKAKNASGQDVVDASVEVDGKPITSAAGAPIELNEGTHTVRVTLPGKPPKEQQVVLSAGEKLRAVEVVGEAPPPPPPHIEYTTITRRPIPAAAFVLLGVTAAALVSYGVFGMWTTIEYSSTSACSHTCNPISEDSSFQGKAAVADISLAVAAAAFTAAAIVFIARPRILERVKTAGAWPAFTF